MQQKRTIQLVFGSHCCCFFWFWMRKFSQRTCSLFGEFHLLARQYKFNNCSFFSDTSTKNTQDSGVFFYSITCSIQSTGPACRAAISSALRFKNCETQSIVLEVTFWPVFRPARVPILQHHWFWTEFSGDLSSLKSYLLKTLEEQNATNFVDLQCLKFKTYRSFTCKRSSSQVLVLNLTCVSLERDSLSHWCKLQKL